MHLLRKVLPALTAAGMLVGTATATAAPGPAIPTATAQQPFVLTKVPGGFSWALAGMTDLDQVRGTDDAAGKQGLPGDGKMFCVPTALTNVLVYLRERGWNGPAGWPAAVDYTAASNYNAGTDAIKGVAAPMGTTTAGTTGAGYYAGLDALLPGATRSGVLGLVGQSTYLSYDDVSSPSPQELAAAGAAGALVLGHISFYKDVTFQGQTVKQWSGGHEFTVTGASSGGIVDPVTLRTRDPASPWVVDTVQSPFADDEHALTRRTLKFYDGTSTIKTRTVWVYDGDTNVIFDAYTLISPQVAFTLPSPNKILWSRIPLLPGPDPVISQQFSTPSDRVVTDLAMTAQGHSLFFLLKGSSAVWRLDPVTGQTRAVARVRGARAIVVGGRSQDVFVAGADTIVRLDGRLGRKLGEVDPPDPVRDLAFDARRNALLALSADGRKLSTFSTRLAAGPVKSLGSSAPRFVGADARGQVLIAGEKQLTATPRAGGARAASVRAYAAARVPLGASKSPVRGVGVLDDGTLAVSRAGKLRLLDTAGRAVTSPLNGLPSVGPIATSLRFNGFTPRSQIKSLDLVQDQFGPLGPPAG